MAAAGTQVFQVPTESAGIFESFDEEDLDLRDDDGSASVFEEIVGSSGAISRVTDQKVARTVAINRRGIPGMTVRVPLSDSK